MNVRLVGLLVLTALLLLFVVMNFDTARVWFFGIRAEMPLALVVIVSAALGGGAGWLVGWVNPRKGRTDGSAKP